jgi:lipoate-protein ligase B
MLGGLDLEQKVLWWVDLGETTAKEADDLQKELLHLRGNHKIPDVVLVTQHDYEITFGHRDEWNAFTPQLLEEVEKIYGTTSESVVAQHLLSKNIKFSRIDRGGGSTVHGPGQQLYYLVLSSGESTIPNDYSLYDIVKTKYNDVLKETILDLFPTQNIEGIDYGSRELLVDNRADLHKVSRNDGKILKLASKGLYVARRNGMVVSHGGIVFFVNNDAHELFKYVLPCGLDQDKARICTLEELRKSPVSYHELHASFQKALSSAFGFTKIEYKNKDDLKISEKYNP